MDWTKHRRKRTQHVCNAQACKRERKRERGNKFPSLLHDRLIKTYVLISATTRRMISRKNYHSIRVHPRSINFYSLNIQRGLSNEPAPPDPRDPIETSFLLNRLIRDLFCRVGSRRWRNCFPGFEQMDDPLKRHRKTCNYFTRRPSASLMNGRKRSFVSLISDIRSLSGNNC